MLPLGGASYLGLEVGLVRAADRRRIAARARQRAAGGRRLSGSHLSICNPSGAGCNMRALRRERKGAFCGTAGRSRDTLGATGTSPAPQPAVFQRATDCHGQTGQIVFDHLVVCL
jgi:hypothetical protein